MHGDEQSKVTPDKDEGEQLPYLATGETADIFASVVWTRAQWAGKLKKPSSWLARARHASGSPGDKDGGEWDPAEIAIALHNGKIRKQTNDVSELVSLEDLRGIDCLFETIPRLRAFRGKWMNFAQTLDNDAVDPQYGDVNKKRWEAMLNAGFMAKNKR
ncbi:hypothetical protein GCM10007242_27870 [Pigmentiphaga litoralis]|nr:hypothetical protein GCM10007242_27870 [Pigmentiphaga litoralis]